MSERKNINNLFQEKFENFEVIPDEIVWKNIEDKLKEKKKRRVIPFWWKLSGIAAVLLLGFFIYTVEFNNSATLINNEKTVTNKEKNTFETAIKKENVAKSEKNKSVNSNQKIIIANTNDNSKDTDNSKIKTTNSIGFKNSKPNANSIVSSENTKNTDVKYKKNSNQINNKIINLSSKNIAFEPSKDKKITKRKSKVITKSEALTSENLKKKESSDTKIIISSDKEKNNAIANTSIDKNKSVLTQNLKTDETINKKNDSTKIAIVEPNALEELQKEKEKKTITEPKLNRWQISSNVAPIYFSSLSSGSPLDDGLKNNQKSYGTNNQSYGIGTSYALNKKLKIRTGINVLNVDYNTNGITYYQTQSVNSKLSNLDLNSAGSSIIIENFSNVNSPFNKAIQKSEGSLNQKLGYIEMPLEISYKVLDKKFGIDFIGGMSTMFLNRNEIYLQSSNLNLKIGEANNLNDVHFSGNLGLGFKYDILKHFQARLEPMFKYQINTFSTDSGGFKPYVFGVYSGINFTF